MLEKTRQRVLRSVDEQRVVVSLSKAHRQFYESEAGFRESHRIVQPMNRGTAPPIVHSLLSIAAQDPGAIVAVMPCDHHYANEDAFHEAMEASFDVAGRRDHSIVLLGAQPDYPETEYGWIELGSPAEEGSAAELFAVDSFREKPSAELAEHLFYQGCVWNTFVMVGKVGAFLGAARQSLPELVQELEVSRLWNGVETLVDTGVYERLPELNFSSEVLSQAASHLLVLRLENAGWTDLGNPVRAEQAAQQSGGEECFDWMRLWRSGREKAAAAAA